MNAGNVYRDYKTVQLYQDESLLQKSGKPQM